MNVRTTVFETLVREVLGPRGGARETLALGDDPRDEYVTGVLSPVSGAPDRARDIDAALDLAEGNGGEDDDEGSVADAEVAPADPGLTLFDPRSLPHSLGLSFTVSAESGRPAFRIAATWARYRRDEASNTWVREPYSIVTGLEPLRDRDALECPNDPGVLLHVRLREDDSGIGVRASVYMINRTAGGMAEGRPETSHLVFQPQIRIHCLRGTTVEPLGRVAPPVSMHRDGGDAPRQRGVASTAAAATPDMEDASMALLYRARRPYARGHMCGVLWREIDPESPAPDGSQPWPIAWVDGELLTDSDRALFSPADVRTELIPSYQITSPSTDWTTQPNSATPVFAPDILAEQWEPARVRSALEPLANEYEAWIARQALQVDTLEPHHQPAAMHHLGECRSALQRIREGIRLVATVDDIRLAFAFANRAIALQSGWSRAGRVVPWRPFQLAFILCNIAGVSDPKHADRTLCDLLWFPTGGGKTEAYLGLAAFAMAYRRRRAIADGSAEDGGGLAILTRYTLRLLTIQQFRRALTVVTACEVLRVSDPERTGGMRGWRPASCTLPDDHIWGTTRFSAGLWVGGGVTPNSLQTHTFMDDQRRPVTIPGALDLLAASNLNRWRGSVSDAPGEPAQVLSCPACRWHDGANRRPTILAIATEGLSEGINEISWPLSGVSRNAPAPLVTDLATHGVRVEQATLTHSPIDGTATLTVRFEVTSGRLSSQMVDSWWGSIVEPALRHAGHDAPTLVCSRPSRPGYVIRSINLPGRRGPTEYDFEIYCPNLACQLNGTEWGEQVPRPATIHWNGQDRWQVPVPAFANPTSGRSTRIPIPAVTVDDQVYHRLPTLVVATVDKFARLAFEPKAGSMFGNVDAYHALWGYYRIKCPPDDGSALPPTPKEHPADFRGAPGMHVDVPDRRPPELIIQDELHLIEGPLGSMVGLYETVVDLLCRGEGVPKYIASTATARQAGTQVRALFDRKLAQFPPPGLSADDSFFAVTAEVHPAIALHAGRLYAAVCAPGRGGLTPIIRVWAALLYAAIQAREATDTTSSVDPFWTVVGYFNAIRELAGVRALYRQDIAEWVDHVQVRSGGEKRLLRDDADRPLELSSRMSSLDLPGLLERLSETLESGRSEDAVLATSMFGTGVDIDRLGLMVVHGQPKTTSAYIQATGRVGRTTGGLVVAIFRPGRPRDLDHYEFFTGYHRSLYAQVEPVTVAPYAPRAREQGIGPLLVAILRLARQVAQQPVATDLRVQQRINGGWFSGAPSVTLAGTPMLARQLLEVFEQRAQIQPQGRRPSAGVTARDAERELDGWLRLARDVPDDAELLYSEASMARRPSHAVVLGDPHHEFAGLRMAFRNTPNSLRGVEATMRLDT